MNRNYSKSDNLLLARLNGFYSTTLSKLDLRKKLLKSLLDAGQFKELIQHAGRFAGRRPSLHIETGLLKRVQIAGLSRHVQQFPNFQSSDFELQLNNAEKLMTTQPVFSGNIRQLNEATLRVLEACKFPETKFVPTSFEYAAENQINKQSSSGFPRYTRKGHVLNELIDQAKALNPSSEMWFWPMTRGFRIQLRKDNSIIKPKIRVMYPYPGSIILLEDSFIIPFVSHFINNNSFYVIGKNGMEISNLLKSKLASSNRILSSDVSSFDQNMLNDVIIMAFGILRTQLILTKEQAELFETMVTYFCSSLMVSKVPGSPSYGFIKDHGIPSGSGFTNMIGTLAHAIVLEYLQPGIIHECLICGDDNIVNAVSVDTKHLFENYKIIFNLPISIEKTDIYTSPLRIKFLGFNWINYVRHVDNKLVINQLLWHTDFLTTLDRYERELARGASVLLNGINGRQLFYLIFPDVISNLKRGLDVRFIYLFGYQPPSSIPGVVSYTKLRGPLPSSSQSLALHLARGWQIR